MIVFSRAQAVNKISDLIDLLGINRSTIVTGQETYSNIDYDQVHMNIDVARKSSLDFLKMELGLL